MNYFRNLFPQNMKKKKTGLGAFDWSDLAALDPDPPEFEPVTPAPRAGSTRTPLTKSRRSVAIVSTFL